VTIRFRGGFGRGGAVHMLDSKRQRWRGTGLSENPHSAINRKRRDDECHAGIPDPISIVRTESQRSTSPWSVPLLTQAHSADPPSIPGKIERSVKKSQLSDPPRRIVFAGTPHFAGPVAIGNSGRKVGRYARALILLPQASSPAVRCSIEIVLCSFPGQVHCCGNRGCGSHPMPRSSVFKSTSQVVSDERP
jgi:hypothetical protein